MRTGLIDGTEAANLLVRTSTNNSTGLIGGPHSVTGYTLTGALAILKRADQRDLMIEHRKGQPTLVVKVPGMGVHAWYLRLNERKVDPWG